MNKLLKILLFLFLILTPVIFHKTFNQRLRHFPQQEIIQSKPKIALIIDDVGSSFKEIQEIYALGIPVTVSIIPGLKYSRQISEFAPQYGFSVFLHLPLEPKKSERYKFSAAQMPIGLQMNDQQILGLLSRYLNSMRNAAGVNNHMGSAVTENKHIMRIILRAIFDRDMIFVDSRTSLASIGYDTAVEMGMIAGSNEGFIDAVDDQKRISEKLEFLAVKAKEKGKIIIIGHPRKNTLSVLKKKLPALKQDIDFVNIRDYFELH